MFFMPGTRMLFGDAKTSCDGKCHLREYLLKEDGANSFRTAIKAALEARK